MFDVAVIGGGPAGMSAALWCAELGVSCVLVEAVDRLGGQILRTHLPISNYPGIQEISGQDLARAMAEQIEAANVRVLSGIRVIEVDLPGKRLLFADNKQVEARTIIIATGVSRRRLGVVGELELVGKGILESGVGQRSEVTGSRVVIVGGGDAAIENAAILAENARSVTVVHRRDRFTARDEYLSQAKARANVSFALNTTVSIFVGDTRLTGVELRSGVTGQTLTLPADHALIRIGVEPSRSIFHDELKTNDDGYIVVDANCMTSEDGVFAVGDVANQAAPTIAGAVGMGATAAKNAYSWLSSDGFRR